MTCQLRPHKLAPKENTNCLLYYDDSVVLCPAAPGTGNNIHTGKSACSTFEGPPVLAHERHCASIKQQRCVQLCNSAERSTRVLFPTMNFGRSAT